jgi:hypothetical protein
MMSDQKVARAVAPYLEPGEELENFAFGARPPHFLIIAFLMFLAVLPGVIAVALLTKSYLVGLTSRRLLVLRYRGRELKVLEIMEYDRGKLPLVKSSTGPLFVHLAILDTINPFRAKFHRRGENRTNALAIVAALNNWQTAGHDKTIPVPSVVPENQKVRDLQKPQAANQVPQQRNVSAAERDERLIFKVGAATRTLAPGMTIEPQLLGVAGVGRGKGPIAEITKLPRSWETRFVSPDEILPKLGLRNLSDRIFWVISPDGGRVELNPAQTAPLLAGLAIDFGGISGFVQRADGGSKDADAPRTLYGPPPQLNRN